MLAESLLLATAVLVIGLVVLVVASDVLVDSAALISARLGLSPIVVGVVVIGFGTSAPELLVTVLAGLDGVFDLGVGNIVGSNIANVLLVLGTAAIVGPIAVSRTTVRREVPLSLLGVLAFAWAVQGSLRRVDAVLLAVLLVVVITFLIAAGSKDPSASADDTVDPRPHSPLSREAMRTIIGLTGTLAGAQAVVLGGGALATAAGLSDGLVGLTLVAVGTSLPELAAAVQAVRRAETDLLVGNILGSNLFNALAVGPFIIWTGASLGQPVSPELSGEAVLLMLAAVVTVSLLLVRRRVGRVTGVALVLGYAATIAVMAT
jgi:cation:H+ antiporter